MKKTRHKLGLTQEQIAKELNCSLRAIWKIENSEMSRSISERYKEYITHKLFEKNALILSDDIHQNGIDGFVTFEKSKTNGIYTYVFKSTYSSSVIYNPFSELFIFTSILESSLEESFSSERVCLILNNKLKSL